MKLDLEARSAGPAFGGKSDRPDRARLDVSGLRRQLRGDVSADAYACGRYATDASIYQIIPQAVVMP
ncbi:MAG: hypothetical protein AAFQ35_15435, partial [Pseudomonadota bacterium]